MEKYKMEILKDDSTPLVVLTRDERGRKANLVGHIKIYNQVGSISWFPYTVREQLDFDSSASLGLVNSIDDLISRLAKEKEMPFLLANGSFPRGCGVISGDDPRLIIVPGKNSAGKIEEAICERLGYDAGMKHRATGKLRLEESGLRVFDFSANYFDSIKDYLDTIAAISRSYLAEEKTPILLHANLGKDHPLEEYFKTCFR